MPEKNCILGLAAGFHYGDLKPFVVSLERTGFAGECVLFVSSTTRDIERIEAHGVRCLPFVRPPQMEHVPYNAFRYFLYQDYLCENSGNYARVLLTDTRDVIFQANPFSFPWPKGLNITLEDRSKRVADCPYMTRWINGHLGEDVLRQLGNRFISCSGTTLGQEQAVRTYLELMTAHLLPFVPGQQMAGYDQGVHNYLLYKGMPFIVGTNDNAGPFLTLGYKQRAPLESDGCVLNDSGEPAILVHQYDRHKELFQRIRQRYCK